jgi:hypothetical protein
VILRALAVWCLLLVLAVLNGGAPWAELLVDYDLSRGRIWIAVLIVTLFAPMWTTRLRGLI